jgi:hypothetical protein
VDEERLHIDMELSDEEGDEILPYSIGTLDNPQPYDDKFDSQEEAEDTAMELSKYNDSIMGVWREEDGEVLAIAYGGILYTP